MHTSSFDQTRWLEALDDECLDEIADAAEQVLMIHEALANDNISLLGELLRDEPDQPITVWQHYPPEDCEDPRSGAMFYYHAHDPDEWHRDEHGHCHLFIRPSPDAEFTHVMAISMTSWGVPSGLFATNGWVTAESMLPARQILELLGERWEVSRARPSWLINQWLSATVKLLGAHTKELLESRDRRLGWCGNCAPHVELLEDRSTHVLSEMALDFPALLQAIQSEVGRRTNL